MSLSQVFLNTDLTMSWSKTKVWKLLTRMCSSETNTYKPAAHSLTDRLIWNGSFVFRRCKVLLACFPLNFVFNFFSLFFPGSEFFLCFSIFLRSLPSPRRGRKRKNERPFMWLWENIDTCWREGANTSTRLHTSLHTHKITHHTHTHINRVSPRHTYLPKHKITHSHI